MPVYQTNEIYLREAVESVLRQTYSSFELLIVNDSPEDNERIYSIIENYKDARIVWISCQTHAGIAIASNTGINRAIGNFIAMMDHDDICFPHRLEQQITFLYNNPEFGFIGAQAEGLYLDKSKVRLNYPIASSNTQLKQSFFDGVPFLNPSVMFRKTVLDIAKYRSCYKICADYDLFARLVFKHNVKATNLPEVVLSYRFHDTNLSLNQYLLAEQETNEIQKWILEYKNN